MTVRSHIVLLMIATLTARPAVADEPAYSQLWGERGERWSADSRLPDFSYAGYHRGERPLPVRRADVNVKEFGAVGDGMTDDTAAFRRALKEAAGKVIGVPAGRYVITDLLPIRDSGTVLQGERPEGSILYFPLPLERIRPNLGATTTGRPTSNYSWSGGFVDVQGRVADKPLAEVAEPAGRGTHELVVDHAERFQVGDDVRLVIRDTADNSLARHLYADDPGPTENLQGRLRVTFLARVVAVNARERRIQLDRALRCDVRLAWKPQLYLARTSVEEVGVEGLTFEFPATPYGGHFTEQGYNAIAISGARNCWVRDVVIRHCDSGIFVQADNATLRGIVLQSDRDPDRSLQCTGHHGVTLGETDCVLTDFAFRMRFIHDVTVTSGSAGNVVMNGRGTDLALDHHRYAPHANLWTNLHAGAGTRLFRSGGGAQLGWHCGAWETFWSIRSDRPQTWPPGGQEPKWGCDLMNLVGLTTRQPAILDPLGKWFEVIAPDRLVPANLYEAQLQRRLDSAPKSHVRP